jgi:hypothetical protein
VNYRPSENASSKRKTDGGEEKVRKKGTTTSGLAVLRTPLKRAYHENLQCPINACGSSESG